MPKIAVPFLVGFTTLLLVIACFLAVFGLKNDGSTIYYEMPYDDIDVVSLPYRHVDGAQDTRYMQFFSTERSIYIDKVLVNYGVSLVSKDNLMSNIFSSEFKVIHFCVVYDISSYEFFTLDDIRNYLADNRIILNDDNFYRGYILPYSLTTYLNSPDIDFSKWNVDSMIERGDIVPYYEIDGIGTDTQLYRDNDGVLKVIVDNFIVGYWNIPIRASGYDYFKGFIGSFGLTVESTTFPRFEYDVENFFDLFGLFKYVFEYLGNVGVFLQVVFSNILYGFVPVFTIYGV